MENIVKNSKADDGSPLKCSVYVSHTVAVIWDNSNTALKALSARHQRHLEVWCGEGVGCWSHPQKISGILFFLNLHFGAFYSVFEQSLNL